MLTADEMQRLRERLSAHRLDAWADRILALARPSIRLNVTDGAAGVDEMRLGGPALLPAGMEWPRYENEPQSFVAQIVLSEVAPFDREHALPPEGRLLFYYYRHGGGSGRVLYAPPGTPLAEHHAEFPSRRVVASLEISVPAFDFFRDDMGSDELDDYQEFVKSLHKYHESISKLLGYSDAIHFSGEAEWQLHLLLQLDSEQKAGMMWGDNGRVYFWIEPEELRARDFSRVYVNAQWY